MYFWKCWRDTRGVFCAFLGTTIGVTLLHRAVAVDLFGLFSSGTLGGTVPIWRETADVLVRMMAQLMPLAGFVLGAQGVGSEFGKQTAPFLLTRPRARRYYLWSSWLVGALEMTVLTAVSLTLFLTRVHITSHTGRKLPSLGQITENIAALLVPAAVIFCLTFCFTVLLKKEQHGTNAAVAAIFSYTGIVAILRLFYDVRIPLFWELYSSAFSNMNPLPLLALTGWLGISLVMIVIAHSYFERVEV